MTTSTAQRLHIPIQSANQFSTHLKSLRKAHGLTQAQLGARIGVGQTRVADIERHPGAISVEQLLQVMHALDARLLLASPPHGAAVSGTRPPATDW